MEICPGESTLKRSNAPARYPEEKSGRGRERCCRRAVMVRPSSCTREESAREEARAQSSERRLETRAPSWGLCSSVRRLRKPRRKSPESSAAENWALKGEESSWMSACTVRGAEKRRRSCARKRRALGSSPSCSSEIAEKSRRKDSASLSCRSSILSSRPERNCAICTRSAKLLGSDDEEEEGEEEVAKAIRDEEEDGSDLEEE